MSEEEDKKLKRWGAVYVRDCYKCGCPLGFGRTVEGKLIPLDLRSPIYAVTGGVYQVAGERGVIRTELSYVSHFATCPHANDFSGARKKDGPE